MPQRRISGWLGTQNRYGRGGSRRDETNETKQHSRRCPTSHCRRGPRGVGRGFVGGKPHAAHLWWLAPLRGPSTPVTIQYLWEQPGRHNRARHIRRREAVTETPSIFSLYAACIGTVSVADRHASRAVPVALTVEVAFVLFLTVEVALTVAPTIA